jgi:hypothetical protein
MSAAAAARLKTETRFVSVSYLGNGYAFPFPMAEQI